MPCRCTCSLIIAVITSFQTLWLVKLISLHILSLHILRWKSLMFSYSTLKDMNVSYTHFMSNVELWKNILWPFVSLHFIIRNVTLIFLFRRIIFLTYWLWVSCSNNDFQNFIFLILMILKMCFYFIFNVVNVDLNGFALLAVYKVNTLWPMEADMLSQLFKRLAICLVSWVFKFKSINTVNFIFIFL